MNEKEIIFQMLGREVDNMISQFGPLAGMFGGSVKKFVFEFVEPYIDAFTNPTTHKLNTNAMKEFTKQEVNMKVNAFMEKFEKERNGVEDFVV